MQVKYTIYVMMQTLITENSGFFLAAKFQAIVIAEASRETNHLGTKPMGPQLIPAYPGLIRPSVQALGTLQP